MDLTISRCYDAPNIAISSAATGKTGDFLGLFPIEWVKVGSTVLYSGQTNKFTFCVLNLLLGGWGHKFRNLILGVSLSLSSSSGIIG